MSEWEEVAQSIETVEPRRNGEPAYSCTGICCSISRQALIFSRRHTQQSGSSPPAVVSAPHTEHATAFFSRSGEIDRFACSRISGDMTVLGFCL